MNNLNHANLHLTNICQKHLTSLLLLVTLMFSAQAQAGIWDDIKSWFSDDEVTDPQPQPAAARDTVKGVASAVATTAVNVGMGLMPTVVESLGVTEAQAKGGLGAIFMAAKATLEPQNYQMIADVVPGIDGLIAAAPPTNAMMGNAMSLLGGSKETAAAANLVTQFKDLGLGTDMIARFSNEAVDYVSDRSTEASDMLAGVVSDYL